MSFKKRFLPLALVSREHTKTTTNPAPNVRPVSWALITAGMLSALPLQGQDVVQSFLTRVDTQAVTWANILVVLGIVLLGGKYMFIDHRDPEKLWGTIWGCLFLLGARAIATFFLPVAAP